MKYNDYTKLELIQLCKLNNIKNYSKLNKDELIKLLKKNKNKKGGTIRNVTKYTRHLPYNTNNNMLIRRTSHVIYGCIIDYFNYCEYFKKEENKDKDLLDYILIYQHDEIKNYFDNKIGIGRSLTHWEEIVEIIKKEKRISLLKFYYLYYPTLPIRYSSKYKINYYKKLYNEMNNYIKNNKESTINDFIKKFIKEKKNKIDDEYKPFITENLITRIKKININQLKENLRKRKMLSLYHNKTIKSILEIINIHIISLESKKLEENMKYIELCNNSTRITADWKTIFNEIKEKKSFIEILTGINKGDQLNINNLKSIYITEDKKIIINDEKEFLKDNKWLINIMDKILKLYHTPLDYNKINETILHSIIKYYMDKKYKTILDDGSKNIIISSLLTLKYRYVEEYKNPKYKTLFNLYYDKAHNSYNITHYMSTKNPSTSKTEKSYRNYNAEIDILYYVKQNIYNSDLLYKIYLIKNHELIPEKRIKYYKKIYDLIQEYNNKNNNNSFDCFMVDYKKKVINNNFKIDDDFVLYIPKFHYCYNKKNKKIDYIYKDLQKNTALYKEWNNIYDLIVLKKKFIYIVIKLEMFYNNYNDTYNDVENDIKNDIEKINGDINELYIYNWKNENKVIKIRIQDKPIEEKTMKNYIKHDSFKNYIINIKKFVMEFDKISNDIYKLSINLENKNWVNTLKKNNIYKKYVNNKGINYNLDEIKKNYNL